MSDGPHDPLIDGIVIQLMAHAKLESGAVDYTKAAAAFIKLLAEMIGPQPAHVQKAMMAEFAANLRTAVLLTALRVDIGQEPPQDAA